MIMKYIPGLHLRVSSEAEEKELDMDQFFDEEIGDWGIFEELERRRVLADTILGQSPVNASMSTARVEETKAPIPIETVT